MSRENLLGDIADGGLTERPHIGVVERHRAVAHNATELGRAIDRINAESRSKDTGYLFRPETARIVRDELHKQGMRAFKNDLGPIGLANGLQLCLIAIMERMPMRCETCNGVGSRWHHGQPVIVCQSCNGSRYRPISDEMRTLAYGRPLDAKEAIALGQILLLWDQNEHSSSAAVSDMYRDAI